MCAYIVFDTETTGFPKTKYGTVNSNNISHWDSCRMVQIAWEVYTDDSLGPIEKKSYIVLPEGFEIPLSSSNIHGILHEYALDHGTFIHNILDDFFNDINTYNISKAVAHNIAFDENVLLSELIRQHNTEKIKIWKKLTKHCTMLKGTKSGGRWPRLNALYSELIGELPTYIQLHRATDDVELCSAIFKIQKNM